MILRPSVGESWRSAVVRSSRGVLAAILLITADDGDADLDEPDSLWRVSPEDGASAAYAEFEHAFTELRRAGEIEGVTVDELAGELVVLANRGARIVLGMPTGFYPGYDREIHELYVYSLNSQ